METRLLIKYSDVFERERDPLNYFEQLRRCVGDIPLNIFATVNSLFCSESADVEAQKRLETELLSDSTKNHVRRLRKDLKQKPSLIFNRAGSLLNLKALLSIERPAVRYAPTAVGAVALHANDYVDISLAKATATILMVQMMPVWELYNPRNIGALLRRYDVIFHELLVKDERVIQLFANEFGIHPTNVRIDGLRIDDYFALLFGLYTVADGGARTLKTSILSFAQHASVLNISADDSNAFLRARSLTLNGFREKLNQIHIPTEFVSRVQDSRWATDFKVFREHPLVALEDGRLLVADLQFLIENAGVGLFWNIFRSLPKHGRELMLGYWGEVFERYVQDQFRRHLTSGEYLDFNVTGTNFEIDVLHVRERVGLVVESKAGSIAQEIKSSRDVERVTAALDRKFVRNERGEPKGVTQLANASHALLDGGAGLPSAVERIYPLLVVDDPSLQTPGTNTYLNSKFTELIGSSGTVAPLTVATIDELELLLPYIGAGDVAWSEVLETRFSGDEVTAKPLEETFASVANPKKLKLRANLVTEESAKRLTELIEQKYADLKK